jgi:hypothetical protein
VNTKELSVVSAKQFAIAAIIFFIFEKCYIKKVQLPFAIHIHKKAYSTITFSSRSALVRRYL